MSEVLAWMILIGLAVTVAGIFMLATQIERYMHRTQEMMLHSSVWIAAKLERANGVFSGETDPYTRDLFDRRRADRRRPGAGAGGFRGPERRTTPDRRRMDLGYR